MPTKKTKVADFLAVRNMWDRVKEAFALYVQISKVARINWYEEVQGSWISEKCQVDFMGIDFSDVPCDDDIVYLTGFRTDLNGNKSMIHYKVKIHNLLAGWTQHERRLKEKLDVLKERNQQDKKTRAEQRKHQKEIHNAQSKILRYWFLKNKFEKDPNEHETNTV